MHKFIELLVPVETSTSSSANFISLKIFGQARNHDEMFLKLNQTSFSGVDHFCSLITFKIVRLTLMKFKWVHRSCATDPVVRY